MLKKLQIIFLIAIVALLGFTTNTFAQSKEESVPTNNSALAEAALPTGAERIKEESVPQEIKDTLAKIIAAGGESVRQGEIEITTWSSASYGKSTSSQLIGKIEGNLQKSGWAYEIGEKNNEFILFTLLRETPERRALIGLFVPTDEGLVLALTEMLPADENVGNTYSEPEAPKPTAGKTARNDSAQNELVGKWIYASTGSMYRNPISGATVAGRATRVTYEFMPDGTVQYAGIMQVTSLANCRMEVFTSKKGKVSMNNGKLTIAFAPATFTRDDSCDRAGNYKKTLPAATETSIWNIKRENDRTQLCLTSAEGETCFDKSN